jgi:hypothetical protein
VNGGPPGSSWGRGASRNSVRNADSNRTARLGELLRGRTVAYATVLGSIGAIVAGAALHSLAVIVAGPLAVIALVAALAFVAADRRSAEDFFRAYASGRGLSYAGDAALLSLTPLLGAGQRRSFEHWMQGPLSRGHQCGLGQYTFEVRKGGGRDQYRETHHFTICVVDLEAGIRLFPGVFLTRRRGLSGVLDGEQWLSHAARHEVKLESAELCDRYELWVDDDQDEMLLRQLFVPSFVVLLAEHPLAPCFEYRAGTLVVYVERRFQDEGHLDWLREVAAQIAERFTAEVEQAA